MVLQAEAQQDHHHTHSSHSIKKEAQQDLGLRH
jgi:hypothetical protein